MTVVELIIVVSIPLGMGLGAWLLSTWWTRRLRRSSAGAANAPAAWYGDPHGRFELRYWDGARWTEHVSTAGATSTDPVS